MKDPIIKILSGIRPEFDFNNASDFIEEGMLDSFDIVTLVTELEDAFGIEIDGESILPENFASVEAICALISNSKK